MVKTTQVDPLFFKTICPSKFVAAVTGDAAAFRKCGRNPCRCAGGLVHHPNIHRM
ncbi:MAG: hypothetical protein ACLSTO_05860 [Bilophila wadsworthia]